MYFYIYDNFLNDRKYERDLSLIETRLTDLGISGKIGRLTAFTNARGLIRDEAKKGAHTIVVVGNDETVAKIIEGVEDLEVTIGIIPVGSSVNISESLGIPYGVLACDVLSKRTTQKIDLGKINGRYFLSQVHVASGKLSIEGEGRFTITTPDSNCELVVSNLRSREWIIDGKSSASQPGNPKDGFLDAIIFPKTGFVSRLLGREVNLKSTVVPLRKMIVMSETQLSVTADGKEFKHDNLSIEIVPDKLKVITGRERAFA